MPLHSTPVGTLQEIEDLGLNKEQYGTCSEPDQSRNVGCRFYRTCKFRRAKDGPMNKGVRIIRRVGERVSVIERVMPCFVVHQTKTMIAGLDGILKVIAEEGEFIKMKLSEHKYKDQPKSSVFTTALKDFEVKKFARPADPGSEFLDEAYLSQLREEETDHIERERELEVLGVDPELRTDADEEQRVVIPPEVQRLIEKSETAATVEKIKEPKDGRKGDRAKPHAKRGAGKDREREGAPAGQG
jgi:hypothetical protein